MYIFLRCSKLLKIFFILYNVPNNSKFLIYFRSDLICLEQITITLHYPEVFIGKLLHKKVNATHHFNIYHTFILDTLSKYIDRAI